jgi:hypothetical protein
MNSTHTPVYMRGYVPLTASGFVESMVEADVCVLVELSADRNGGNA